MKIFILVTSFFITSYNILAQDYKFSIGLTYQPFIYENYNQSDWNNRPNSIPNNSNNFNGNAFGIIIGVPLKDFFTIKSEITYSIQSQDHKIATNGDSIPGIGVKYYYGKTVHTKFEIIKLPIMASFSYELGYNSGLFVNGYLGGQISFLNTYSSVFKGYYFDEIERKIDMDSIIDIVTRTPKHLEQIIWDDTLNPPGFKESRFETDYFYNRWLFGALGGLEFQKVITTNILLGIGGRIEYDFTNSEKYPDQTFSGLGGLGDKGPRAKSHNIRYGLSFSAIYLFN